AVGLYVNFIRSVPNRLFPVYFRAAKIMNPEFAYPFLLIAASLTTDHYHHWYDILVGRIIGSMIATGAYRFQYASIWDYRFNDIPLPRTGAEFGYDYGLEEFNVIPRSRKGGWN
ncbi:unnamed protein product, partial [Didymodactylos carnosus]